MEEKKLPGTIVFYGCPAEEVLTGKVFMARNGALMALTALLHGTAERSTGSALVPPTALTVLYSTSRDVRPTPAATPTTEGPLWTLPSL